jgi:glycerophosphoryl diester phosphodiesterase
VIEAIRERDLLGRAMVSTMEMHSLKRILELEPKLRRGWTYPKTTRDWTKKPWARPVLPVALQGMRLQLPGLAAQKLPQFNVFAMWVYHPLISTRLARICELAGVELIAWTVDEEKRMRKLVELGVTGLVSNDPRLFKQL